MHILQRTISLKIFEINVLFSEQWQFLSYPKQVLPKSGWGAGVRLLAFIKRLILGLLHIRFRSVSIKQHGILFFADSINQRNALVPVLSQVKNGYLVGHHNVRPQQLFPLFWAHLFSIPFLPCVILNYFGASSYRKKTFRYAFDQYWLTYGYYIAATHWLNQLQPKALVISNDHNMPHRVLTRVARELGIPTVYLQHASVTTQFPLLAFDYALLDGLDALEKYSHIGVTDTRVFLVGMPKLDPYLDEINQQPKVQVLGICTNSMDDIETVENLCTRIRHKLPSLRVILRPHPGDKRMKQWQDLASRLEARFSDSRNIVSFEFLKTVDAVLVGDSNILLEATLVNVYPLHYDFTQQKRDHYGFVSKGLTEYFCEPEQIIMKLQGLMLEKPDVQNRAQRYCATVGTQYAGQSSKLAATIIEAIVAGTIGDSDVELGHGIGLIK